MPIVDSAFPERYRRSGGWRPPGEEGDMFASLPPVTYINHDTAYATVPPAAPTSGYATTSLILGFATLVTAGITAIPAAVFGHLGIRETETGAHSGRWMAIIGLVLGYLAITGWAVFLFLMFSGTAGSWVSP